MRRRRAQIDRAIDALRGASEPAAAIDALVAVGYPPFEGPRGGRPPAAQVDQLLAALAQAARGATTPELQLEATVTLSKWFSAGAERVLLALLADASQPPRVRGFAAEGLHNVARTARHFGLVKSTLIASLADPSPDVRFWCLYSLGQLEVREARAEIERLARDDEAPCVPLWRVCDEARDVLAYFDTGVWPDRPFDPPAPAG